MKFENNPFDNGAYNINILIEKCLFGHLMVN